MPPPYTTRVRAVPTPLRVVIFAPFVLIGLLLGGYWCWMFEGPYRWLVNSEIALTGVYYPFYTGFFTVMFTTLFCALPGTLIQYLLVWLEVFPVADAPRLALGKLPSNAADRWAPSAAPESRRPPTPPDDYTS